MQPLKNQSFAAPRTKGRGSLRIDTESGAFNRGLKYRTAWRRRTYQIHNLLLKNRKSVAVAESCTGGLLSKVLTDISGSSKYFILGVIAYHNSAKEKILKIPAQIISKNGAVSAAAALEMAQKIRKLARADIGIGITGIAGPAGGTAIKPVGTVFISIAAKNKNFSKQFRFTGSRLAIRQKSANKALELLKKFI